jgi:rhomboid protease GluP
MQDAEPAATYRVRFERFGDFSGNLDLRGKGSIKIEEAGQRLVFSGAPKATTEFASTAELAFRAEQIWKVTTKGSKVQFLTSEGQAGLHRRPFVFYCDSPRIASEVAALLAGKRDPLLDERQQFDAKLDEFAASTPWTSVTNVIVGANVLAFVLMGFLGAGWLTPDDMMTYVRFGANNGAATTDGEWWRLVSSMFMHYGVLHLALNMWAFIQVGHLAERLFGQKAYLVIYFGSGITSGLASNIWHGDKLWSAGASGAIFGVYGSLLGFMLRDEQLLPKSVYKPLLKSTALFVGYNLFYGAIQSGIDNAAHCGGLFGGLVLGWLTAVPIERELRVRFLARRLRAGVVAAMLLVAVGVAIAPRYDYRPIDEMRWQKVVEPRIASEQALLKQQNLEINRYRSTGDPGNLSIWTTFKALPFYDDWRSALLALPLEPDRRTSRRRDKIISIIQMKTESYRHLLADLTGPELYPLRRFDDENKAVIEAIRQMSVP